MISLEEVTKLGAGVIIDEDFTDGNFDTTNLQYWEINGIGTNFRSPNNRDFDYAISNQISQGGASFSDNISYSIPDATTPSGNAQFGIAKEDEVAIIRYTTFSDVASNSRERYHIQVALLQSDPTLEGSPHFGHDLSIETENRFVSLSSNHPNRVQLTTSVENIEPVNQAVRNAHYNNTTTTADLDQEYTSLVIFRNQPETNTTNVEQWGHNLFGDYDIATSLENEFTQNQNPDYSFFNEIQVFFQRGDTRYDLIRDDIDINDAQIGITQLHVGITKKTDFNLDYRTDARDFIRWNYYRFQDGLQNLQTGDGNNDGLSNELDLALWNDYRGEIHDPNFDLTQSSYSYNLDEVVNSSYFIEDNNHIPPEFSYDPSTGNFYIDTQGEFLLSWVTNQPAISFETLGDNWWIDEVGNTQQWVDLDLTGISTNEPTLVATFASGLEIADFGLTEYGLADGSGGIVELVTNNNNNNSDLVTTFFDVEDDFVNLGNTNISFTIANEGAGAVIDDFQVEIFYSADDDIIGNADDILLDSILISDSLASGESITRSQEIQLPISEIYDVAQNENPSIFNTQAQSTSVDYLGIVIDRNSDISNEINKENNLNLGMGTDIDDISYFPWDIDNNGIVTPSDVIFVINRLGNTANTTEDLDYLKADIDGNGLITPTDAIAVINRLGYFRNEGVIEG